MPPDSSSPPSWNNHMKMGWGWPLVPANIPKLFAPLPMISLRSLHISTASSCTATNNSLWYLFIDLGTSNFCPCPQASSESYFVPENYLLCCLHDIRISWRTQTHLQKAEEKWNSFGPHCTGWFVWKTKRTSSDYARNRQEWPSEHPSLHAALEQPQRHADQQQHHRKCSWARSCSDDEWSRGSWTVDGPAAEFAGRGAEESSWGPKQQRSFEWRWRVGAKSTAAINGGWERREEGVEGVEEGRVMNWSLLTKLTSFTAFFLKQ